MKALLTLVLALLFCSGSNAQTSNLGAWYNYFGSKKIGNRFNLHHEVQYRNYNAVGDLEQLLLRTGIGYNLTENNNNFLLGYGFIYSENYNPSSGVKSYGDEHRIFQQFITKQNFGRFNLQHRFRFEQRFIESEVYYRGRYFLGLNVALNHSTMIDKTFYLTAYDEVFLIHNKPPAYWSSYYGNSIDFGRNRAYIGLGYKFNNKIKVELAYMNQYFNEINQRDQINIACFANF